MPKVIEFRPFYIGNKAGSRSEFVFEPKLKEWIGPDSSLIRQNGWHLSQGDSAIPCEHTGTGAKCGEWDFPELLLPPEDIVKGKRKTARNRSRQSTTKRTKARVHSRKVIVPGVGSCMAELISNFFSIKDSSGCNCKAYASKMDKWGPEGCELHREEIINHLAKNTEILRKGIQDLNIPGCGLLSKLAGTSAAIPLLKIGANWLLTKAISSHKSKKEAATKVGPKDAIKWIEPNPLNLTRNLAIHVFPVIGKWEWLIEALKDKTHLFNGRKLVSIVTSKGDSVRFKNRTIRLQNPETVAAQFRELGFEVSLRENSVRTGEFVSFAPMVKELYSTDPSQVTLYLHSKGSKHPDNEFRSITKWNETMLSVLLDIESVTASFSRGNDLVGALGGDVFGDGNVPMGSFYWFRNSTGEATVTPHKNPFFTSESWPSKIFNQEYLLGAVDGSRPFKQLYTANFWDNGEGSDRLKRFNSQRVHSIEEPKITLITPTGDRPEAFRLCEKWISQQTLKPFEWIVIDDGEVPTQITQGQNYIRRQGRKSSEHTLPDQMLEALKYVTGDFVIMIEDDDYYHPEYLQLMVQQLQTAELVGEVGARYYYLPTATFRHYTEHTHSSFCRTGFRKNVIPLLSEICKASNESLDINLWEQWTGTKQQQWKSTTIGCIGIKGMPGRKSHNKIRPEIDDHNLKTLKQWCPDWNDYLPFLKPIKNRVEETGTLFSILLREYDRFRPVSADSRFDRQLLTDSKEVKVQGWNINPVKHTPSDPKQSRHLKILATQSFPDADWILYHDAQLQLKCSPSFWFDWVRSQGEADIYFYHHHQRHCVYKEAKEVMKIRKDKPQNVQPQIARYASQKIPENLGLYLGGLHIRRNTEAVKAFEEIWWREVKRGSVRDQISLPVALRESGVKFLALPPMSWTQHFQRYTHLTNTPVIENMSANDIRVWENFKKTK